MMEQQSLPHPQQLQLCPPLPLITAAKTFKLPETPPFTPGLLEDITPRTPRKPTNPRQTATSVNRGNSAIISFKMVKNCSQVSPSLQITSLPPAKRHISSARRRLWVLPGEICEPLTLESAITSNMKDQTSSSYVDSLEGDDEMEGNSPISCFSPPYSPFYEEAVSEAAAKPSSSSYPYSTHTKEKKSMHHFISPKVRSATKSKTCASCKTKKTPLWRDSEDGTPYCNACGIRFKKYRFRCSSCSYIPRKDEREVSKSCCLCGARLIHCKVSGRH